MLRTLQNGLTKVSYFRDTGYLIAAEHRLTPQQEKLTDKDVEGNN
jgi:hypothetical protein